MKNLLLITMLLGVGHSECNESTWPDYYPDLSGCWLGGASLSQANWPGVDLSGAHLEWATLAATDLNGANLTDANCWGATFVGADLEGTIFDENEDGYDDVSYEVGYYAGTQSGDANLDGNLTILNLVLYANMILYP